MANEQDGTTQRALLAGRYRVEEELGRGGMAKVFRGTDMVLGRQVAIKILAPQFVDDANFVTRFRREAQAAARLNNPHVVGVYDTGSDDGVHYIVMEYVEARTLADYLAGGGRIMPERAVELAESVCEALAVAHAAGIVHRDIKPANIMVSRDGRVKVTDFGIARLTTSADTVAQTAAVLGTASYLSPEQAQGQPVDRRSDLYSLGAVMYEMVTGRPPFTGESAVAVASKHVLEQPDPPSTLNPDVSPELDAVIMKALAKNPANRYQSAEEMREDLERVRTGRPVEATPLLPASETTQVISRPERTAVLPPAEAPTGGGGRRWIGVTVAILILAMLGAGAYLLASGLLRGNDTPVQVRVPNVIGFTQAAAEHEIRSAGLKPVVRTQVSSDPADYGNVIDQTPSAGELVRRGDTVTITVGKAPKQVDVPDLTGLTLDQAKSALDARGLIPGAITTAPSLQPTGTVIDQSPPPNTPVARGSTVDIVLSEGPKPLTVPDEVCQSLGHAQSELEKMGFTVVIDDTQVQYNPDCPELNHVAAQDPVAGSPAHQGDTVTLIPTTNVSPTPSPSTTSTPSPSPSPSDLKAIKP
jgi:beta-lactam-binding protein with PASTA domain/tRNA A-37 threonylcarbamoyl transferase component Bud32